jgi:hypothetical protein
MKFTIEEATGMVDTYETGLRVRDISKLPKNGQEMAKYSPIVTREVIEHWAYRLELAAQLSAGHMDSESRHLEVAQQKQAIMLAVAAEMRAL